MMVINGYRLIGELNNDNSGYAKWGFAYKDGKEVFIKEFLSPTYPVDATVLSEKQIAHKRDICYEFEREKRTFYNELNKCSTGNVVTINDFFRFNSKYYMVTDKINTETIHPEEICRLPFEQKFLILKIILHSIKSLHEHKIVHGDLKPNNILFKRTPKGYFTAKIIDFDSGFLETNPPKGDEELQGDQVYLAPESFLFMVEENDTLTQKIDVFALGVLFHQYWCGELPKFDTTQYDYMFEAVLDDAEITLHPAIPPQIREIIKKMLDKDPEKRPYVDDIFAWLTGTSSKPKPPVPDPKPEPVNEVKKSGASWLKKAGDL